ncbi:MAG: DUF2627 domain-containing protein [Alicyclobacillus herbarius]|nr:DUF2627 domain-containing protein [Alicyclobacillus herbarius]
MRSMAAWSILLIVFLLAGEGFNLFRVHVEQWLAFGHASDALWSLLGLLLGFASTGWLGGFVYYRDKKRGKVVRRGRKSSVTS